MWGADGSRAEAKINLWEICEKSVIKICEKSVRNLWGARGSVRGSVSGTVRCEGVCEGICKWNCGVWGGLWGDLPAAIWIVKVFVISVNEMWGAKEMWGKMKWGSTGVSRQWQNVKGSASGPVRERSATRHILLTCTHPDCSTSRNLFTYINEDPDFPTDFSQISHRFLTVSAYRKITDWKSK